MRIVGVLWKVVLVVLILFAAYKFRYLAHPVSNALGDLFSRLNDDASMELELSKKSKEVGQLRSQLASLQGLLGYKPETDLVIARLFSHYPLNDKRTLVIDKGSDHGLRIGMSVSTGEGLVIGVIRTVKSSQSEIMTIFDPDWKSSVSIGSGRIKGVLRGGSAPIIDLLPLDADVMVGDDVLNVSPDLPMNAYLGRVHSAVSSDASTWQSFKLSPAVPLGDIEVVLINTKFP